MDNTDQHDPLLNAQQQHLALIMAESSGTDAKALAIGAANIAVLLFIAQAHLTFTSVWQHGLLLVPFIVSLVCNMLAILPYHYLGAGVSDDAIPEYLSMERSTLVLQLLSNTQESIKANDRLNKIRWRYCAVSIGLSLIGAAILFVIL